MRIIHWIPESEHVMPCHKHFCSVPFSCIYNRSKYCRTNYVLVCIAFSVGISSSPCRHFSYDTPCHIVSFNFLTLLMILKAFTPPFDDLRFMIWNCLKKAAVLQTKKEIAEMNQLSPTDSKILFTCLNSYISPSPAAMPSHELTAGTDRCRSILLSPLPNASPH